MMAVIQRCMVTVLLLCASAVACAGLAVQRQQFLAARQACASGDPTTCQRLGAGLTNYPLYPHLRYAYLRDRMATVGEHELRAFIRRYADSTPAVRLRNDWLFDLAGARRWREFLALYQDSDDAALRCYHLQARLNTAPDKDHDALLAEAETLWRIGHSQPKACDAVFERLAASPRMTDALVWARIRLAMEEGELQLAGYLARHLSKAEQNWVERWQAMYQRPATQLNSTVFNDDLPIVREIVAFGVRRLARSAADTAHTRWQQLKPRYHFSAAQRGEVACAIAIAAARQGNPRALNWMAEIRNEDTDATLREWRIRSAVLAGDWRNLERWIGALPKDEQTEAWHYWRARALEQSGSSEGARLLYKEAARERSYYGFLANDRLHQDYALNDRPTPEDAAQRAKMEARLSIRAAHEFYQLGLVTEARREWSFATRSMNPGELAQAALLAKRWGWYERAIITAAKGSHWDDLALRFPTPYSQQVVDNARLQQLDPSWVYGVMRQESAFMADAKSSAGALGLMQLMPATAKHTAQLLGSPPHSTQQLLRPEHNILLGSAYLRYVLDRFRGNQMLATASYNAGPGRVRQWLPPAAAPADQWVEAIPFTETRKYVQSVMSYSVIFDWRLQQPVQPLQQRMGSAVPTREELYQ